MVDTYPNYFGDVSRFVRNLQLACLGRPGIEYTVAPQEVGRPRELQKPGFGALFRRYTRWIEKSHLAGPSYRSGDLPISDADPPDR
ncbi:hypothetical protein SAMN04487974_11560 [Pelagibacterium luteolum]|uniref:Uncharacterized protein n=1 Tax=Pelagibacterium luteolum TaxID=440168 RepID=A0A1G7YUE4_9HYPH|nr:hypothetical protein SAMN04487974_11560 [Pelagibacterium luteolum]